MATIESIVSEIQSASNWITAQIEAGLPPDNVHHANDALSVSIMAQLNHVMILPIDAVSLGAAVRNSSFTEDQKTLMLESIRTRVSVCASGQIARPVGVAKLKQRFQSPESSQHYLTDEDWAHLNNVSTTLTARVQIVVDRFKLLGLNDPTETTFADLATVVAAIAYTPTPDNTFNKEKYDLVQMVKSSFAVTPNKAPHLQTLPVFPTDPGNLPSANRVSAYGDSSPARGQLMDWHLVRNSIPCRSTNKLVRDNDQNQLLVPRQGMHMIRPPNANAAMMQQMMQFAYMMQQMQQQHQQPQPQPSGLQIFRPRRNASLTDANGQGGAAVAPAAFTPGTCMVPDSHAFVPPAALAQEDTFEEPAPQVAVPHIFKPRVQFTQAASLSAAHHGAAASHCAPDLGASDCYAPTLAEAQASVARMEASHLAVVAKSALAKAATDEKAKAKAIKTAAKAAAAEAKANAMGETPGTSAHVFPKHRLSTKTTHDIFGVAVSPAPRAIGAKAPAAMCAKAPAPPPLKRAKKEVTEAAMGAKAPAAMCAKAPAPPPLKREKSTVKPKCPIAAGHDPSVKVHQVLYNGGKILTSFSKDGFRVFPWVENERKEYLIRFRDDFESAWVSALDKLDTVRAAQ